MRRLWNPDRDTNYHLGLALLIGASLTLVWAIWQEAFEPRHFLVYFLIYGWGYVLLLKSDMEFRFIRLEKEYNNLFARVELLEERLSIGQSTLGDTTEEERPDELSEGGELFQELWGESINKQEKSSSEVGETKPE